MPVAGAGIRGYSSELVQLQGREAWAAAASHSCTATQMLIRTQQMLYRPCSAGSEQAWWRQCVRQLQVPQAMRTLHCPMIHTRLKAQGAQTPGEPIQQFEVTVGSSLEDTALNLDSSPLQSTRRARYDWRRRTACLFSSALCKHIHCAQPWIAAAPSLSDTGGCLAKLRLSASVTPSSGAHTCLLAQARCFIAECDQDVLGSGTLRCSCHMTGSVPAFLVFLCKGCALTS